MRLHKWSLGLAATLCWAGTSDAGILDRFKPKSQAQPTTPAKPTPQAKAATPSKATAPNTAADRVDEWVQILRGEGDDRRRLSAVVELSKVDLRQFPQAGEALIEALRSDANPAVRAGAATALGRIRPLTVEAAQALEEALLSDGVPRVRTAAKTALTPYLQAGYRPQSNPPAAAAAVPPASTPRAPIAKKNAPSPSPGPLPNSVLPPRSPSARVFALQPNTEEPPLADVRPNEPVQELLPPMQQPSSVLPPRSPLSPPAQPKADNLEPQPIKPTPAKPARPSTDNDGPILNGPG